VSLNTGRLRNVDLRPILAGAIAVVVALSARSILLAGSADGCGPVAEGTIVESDEFTPYGARFGSIATDRGLSDTTGAPPAQANFKTLELGGMARRATIVSGDGVFGYFFDESIDHLTMREFARLGGIELGQTPITGAGSFHEYLRSMAGDRAVAVKIGPYKGTLTWADPDVNGTRTHNLYWSDEVNNYSLITDQSAARVLNLARSLVC
jgi:hypothetical protein